MYADFHIHTKYSKCSDIEPSLLVKVALQKKYNAIAIVDHDNIKGGFAVRKFAGKNLIVIPGEEKMTDRGEILIFFSDGKYGTDLIEICERAKDMNHFVIAAHPFDFFRKSLGKNIASIKPDAIEVFNSRSLLGLMNGKAADYAYNNSIPKIGGSDAHFIEEIGNVSVFLDCDNNEDSIIEAIRKEKLVIDGKKGSLMPHIKTNILLPLRRII